MNDDDDKNAQAFVDKLKDMDADGVNTYLRACATIRVIIATIGIGIILFSMFFPTFLTLIITSFLVFLLANIQVGLCNMLRLLRLLKEKIELEDK